MLLYPIYSVRSGWIQPTQMHTSCWDKRIPPRGVYFERPTRIEMPFTGQPNFQTEIEKEYER